MDTLLKYIFYLALIFIIYLILAGFYEGKISKNSTISEVSQEISNSAGEIIRNSYTDVEKEIENKDKNNEKTNNSDSVE